MRNCCRFGEDGFVMREVIQEVTTFVNSEYELENVSISVFNICIFIQLFLSD